MPGQCLLYGPSKVISNNEAEVKQSSAEEFIDGK
jgi:hypothetical protein